MTNAQLAAEVKRLEALVAELRGVLVYANRLLFDALGGGDDACNRKQADDYCRPIREAIAKAKGGA